MSEAKRNTFLKSTFCYNNKLILSVYAIDTRLLVCLLYRFAHVS